MTNVSATKAGAGDYDGTQIAAIPISEDPDDSLYLIVYEKDMPDRFMDVAATRGTEVTEDNLDLFYIKAYAEDDWHDNETNQNFTAGEYFAATEVTLDSGSWEMADEYDWLNNVPLSLWSWNAVEPEVDPADGYDKASFSYSLLNSVTSQEDLIFAYNGENRKFDRTGAITEKTSTNTAYNRTDNEVDVHFYHALSAIKFDISGVQDGQSVDQITIGGVASSGDCEITVSGGVPEFEWDNLGTAQSYSQTFSSTDFDTDGKQVAGGSKEFFMIPQALTDAATLTVTFDGTASTPKAIKAGGVEWKAGKYYTYKISKTAYEWDYTFTFSSEEDSPTLTSKSINDNIETSKSRTIKVISNKIREDNPTNPVDQGWKILSYKVEGSEAVTVNGLSFADDATGMTVTANSGTNTITIEAAARNKFGKGTNEYWTRTSPTEDVLWSPADWSGTATLSNPIDLSKFNYQTDTPNSFNMTTANCYVIRHAGTYMIPLVYGNAMNGGISNKLSYYPNADGSMNMGADATTNGELEEDSEGHKIRLVHFQNHLGNDITDSFIENNAGCSASDGVILWQSDDEVVKNLVLIGDEQTVGDYNKDNVRYLRFTVDSEKICQNVTLIALRNSSGTVMWSWQIWTTNDPALIQSSIEVKNHVGNTYDFFPLPNIGHIEGWTYKERKNIEIVLLQDGPEGKTIKLVVEQPEVNSPSFNALYQFGRKDPTCNKDDIAWYNSSILSSPITTSLIDGGATLADFIQNPCVFYLFASSITLKNPYRNLWSGKNCINGSLEQNESLIKTVYDPSPIGYKVPAGNAFTGFTTTGGELWRTGATSNPEEMFSMSKVNGYYDNSRCVFFYRYPSMGQSGGTIKFTCTGIRAGGSGEILNQEKRGWYGWYYTANCDKDERPLLPYLMEIYFSSNTSELIQLRPSTTAGLNAHGLRPVIDPTMPNNPMQ